MDISKAFSFPFEDDQWPNKLGLGALIMLVPILNFAWSGYTVELMRNVLRGAPQPLPTWDDLGRKFQDGLLLLLAGLVYALPVLVLVCLPLSFMVVPAVLSGNGDTQEIANALAGLGSVLFLCLFCVFAIYGLALSVVFPAIQVLFAREGTLAACFKFQEILALIRGNASPFLTAWAVNLGLSFASSLVLGVVQSIALIPCIGWIIAPVLTIASLIYTSMVSTHLFGQFGRQAFSPAAELVPAS